jgi:uncharacterized protein involved in outer membrane biogenesis
MDDEETGSKDSTHEPELQDATELAEVERGSDAALPSPVRRSRVRWLLLALIAACIGLAIAWFDWNLFKGYVERRVGVATGREFHIDGNLDVRLSMHPLITMDGLRLGNIKGATQPTLATAQRLQFRVALWPLLQGRTELPEVHLVHPTAALERYADGTDNWDFPSAGSSPVIRQFTVDHGRLSYREDASHTDLLIAINSEPVAGSSQLAPLSFQGTGTYRSNLFNLQGRADSPLALSSTAAPYRVDIAAIAGQTRAHASGALRNPLQLHGFDLDFTLAGPDLGLLYRLMGIATPETPRYSLHGRLGHVGHVWSFNRFTGMVGGSDLSGDLSVDNNGSKKLLTAALVSRRLDVHDLAGFIGAPSHADPAKASTVKQQVEAEKAASSDRLLPQQPYDLERLRGMDADVSLRAQRVIGTRVPLDTLRARLVIKDGVARLDPMNFGMAGGQVQSAYGLDASRPVIASTAKIKLRHVDLGELIPQVPAVSKSAGRIGADIDLHGNGNSIAKMLATSDGRVVVGMGGGKISDLLMADAGLNIAKILKLKLTGDQDIAVRCSAGNFAARDGIWNTDSFVFDSADTVIRGAGDIDLRNERVNLLLRVRPKGRSLLSLRSPLRVSGSFTHSTIRPDMKALGIRGVAVAVLAAIAPPAAELGLIEYGGGKDSDCLASAVVGK